MIDTGKKNSHRQRIVKWFNNSPSQEYGGLMDKVALREVSHKVRNAIARLPMQHQRVLEMAYFDGLSQSEIAEQLNMPLGTVKTYKRKGLLKLRELLQELVN